MDVESVDDDNYNLTSECGGETRQDWLGKCTAYFIVMVNSLILHYVKLTLVKYQYCCKMVKPAASVCEVFIEKKGDDTDGDTDARH